MPLNRDIALGGRQFPVSQITYTVLVETLNPAQSNPIQSVTDRQMDGHTDRQSQRQK